MSAREDLEKRLATQATATDKQREEQEIVDLTAFADARDLYGVTNVGRLDITYVPGLPTMALVRTPTVPETKRHRHRTTPRHERDRPDFSGAAEELTASVLIYPDKDVFERMADSRPGLASQLALIAATLATGREYAEGKG